MSYSVKIKASAKKTLTKIDRQYQINLINAIDSLAENPHQGTQLKGSLTGLRRIRVVSYRVIYEVLDKQLVVLVVRIGHRKDIYQ